MLVKNYLKANKNRLWSLGSACHQKDTGEKSVSMHILSGSKTNHTQNQIQMDHFLLEQYFSSWEKKIYIYKGFQASKPCKVQSYML